MDQLPSLRVCDVIENSDTALVARQLLVVCLRTFDNNRRSRLCLLFFSLAVTVVVGTCACTDGVLAHNITRFK